MIASSGVLQVLEQFVTGAIDASALYERILAIEDGGDLLDSDKDLLMEMRLLLLEYGEGLRPLSDALASAVRVLSNDSGSFNTSLDSNTTETINQSLRFKVVAA